VRVKLSLKSTKTLTVLARYFDNISEEQELPKKVATQRPKFDAKKFKLLAPYLTEPGQVPKPNLPEKGDLPRLGDK
jgi:hypothetical protein